MWVWRAFDNKWKDETVTPNIYHAAKSATNDSLFLQHWRIEPCIVRSGSWRVFSLSGIFEVRKAFLNMESIYDQFLRYATTIGESKILGDIALPKKRKLCAVSKMNQGRSIWVRREEEDESIRIGEIHRFTFFFNLGVINYLWIWGRYIW